MRCALIKKEQGFGRFALCAMRYAFIRPMPHAFRMSRNNPDPKVTPNIVNNMCAIMNLVR